MQLSMDYEQARSTRRCAVTGRELNPGETVYSVLMAEGANLVRHDYAAEAWDGAPRGGGGLVEIAIAAARRQAGSLVPNDVMLDLLEQLADDPAHADMRYVLALLLVRRRVCRLEEDQRDEQQHETLVLFCPRREREYRVAVVAPNTERTKEIQDELARLLFAG